MDKHKSCNCDSTNGTCGACNFFDKIPFPTNAFNPPQKDEFFKRICNKRCKDCPFIGWPFSGGSGRDGKPGPPGPKGDPGIFLNPIEEDPYIALPDDEKMQPDVLWVVYPNGFLN